MSHLYNSLKAILSYIESDTAIPRVGRDLDLSIYVLIFLRRDTYVIMAIGNWQDIFAPIPTSILQLSDRKDELLRDIGLVVVLHIRGEWI